MHTAPLLQPDWATSSFHADMFTVWVDRRHGYVETHFVDATWCPGCVEGNDLTEYRIAADQAGYGDDLGLCAIQNDLLHSFLALRAGLPFSPALWGTAHQRWFPWWEQEESAVYGMQCAVNHVAVSDWHSQALEQYLKWVRPRTTLDALSHEASAWLAPLTHG